MSVDDTIPLTPFIVVFDPSLITSAPNGHISINGLDASDFASSVAKSIVSNGQFFFEYWNTYIGNPKPGSGFVLKIWLGLEGSKIGLVHDAIATYLPQNANYLIFVQDPGDPELVFASPAFRYFDNESSSGENFPSDDTTSLSMGVIFDPCLHDWFKNGGDGTGEQFVVNLLNAVGINQDWYNVFNWGGEWGGVVAGIVLFIDFNRDPKLSARELGAMIYPALPEGTPNFIVLPSSENRVIATDGS